MSYSFDLMIEPEQIIDADRIASAVAKFMNYNIDSNQRYKIGKVRPQDISFSLMTSMLNMFKKKRQYELKNIPIVDHNDNIVGFIPGKVVLTLDEKKANTLEKQKMTIATDDAFLFKLLGDKDKNKKITETKLLSQMQMPTITMAEIAANKDTKNGYFQGYIEKNFKRSCEDKTDTLYTLREDFVRGTKINNNLIFKELEATKIKSDRNEIIIKALKENSFSETDIEHLKEAYTQEPSYFLYHAAAGAATNLFIDYGIIVDAATDLKQKADYRNLSKDENGDIYFTQVWYDVRFIKTTDDSGQVLTNLPGPHISKFKLIPPEKDGESWAFQLVSCSTKNEMMFAALQGKMFKYAEGKLMVDDNKLQLDYGRK